MYGLTLNKIFKKTNPFSEPIQEVYLNLHALHSVNLCVKGMDQSICDIGITDPKSIGVIYRLPAIYPQI